MEQQGQARQHLLFLKGAATGKQSAAQVLQQGHRRTAYVSPGRIRSLRHR